MPTLATFLNLIVLTALLIAATYGLRRLWVRAAPVKLLVLLIAPGVAVHELSHAIACLLTGAKINKIVLFRFDGSGEVRHGKPKLKYLGDVMISLAPLAGGAACLWLLGILLDTPVNFYSVRASGVSPNTLNFLLVMIELVWDDLVLAITKTDWLSWKSWVFVYFAMCFTLSMGPSPQDLKNGTAGIGVIALVVLLLHLIVDLLFQSSGDGPVFEFIGNLLLKLHYPFAACALCFALWALVYLISLPFKAKSKKRR